MSYNGGSDPYYALAEDEEETKSISAARSIDVDVGEVLPSSGRGKLHFAAAACCVINRSNAHSCSTSRAGLVGRGGSIPM